MTALSRYDFNSHAHVERDVLYHVHDLRSRHFNSHAHVERDWLLRFFLSSFLHFNSHAHVERDQSFKKSNGLLFISTHTLTWSVTISREYLSCPIVISTHTLTWSVTQRTKWFSNAMTISTHTLTWSVTLDVVYIWCLLNVMRTYFFI